MKGKGEKAKWKYLGDVLTFVRSRRPDLAIYLVNARPTCRRFCSAAL
jgi:hypothetical protein